MDDASQQGEEGVPGMYVCGLGACHRNHFKGVLCAMRRQEAINMLADDPIFLDCTEKYSVSSKTKGYLCCL